MLDHIGRRARRLVAWVLLASATFASLPGSAQTTFEGNGTWWNPAEPGTGFFIEAQGNLAVISFFVYADSGAPTWYSALGSFTAEGGDRFRFRGELQQFRRGPHIDLGLSARTPASTPLGAVTVDFQGRQAQVQLPKRSFAASKFATRPAAVAAGPDGRVPVVPETGVFWDPVRNGRGFTVEVDGNMVTIGLYGFTGEGEPTWRLAVAELSTDAVTVLPSRYKGGQTLDGAYRPAVADPLPAGSEITFQFETPCFGAIGLNGPMFLERLAFQGGGCRQANKAAPVPRLVLAPDVAASTSFSERQLRAIAARAWQLNDLLTHNESLATMLYSWHQDASPGRWRGSCGTTGEYGYERVDVDGNNALNPGDTFDVFLTECRFQLNYPGTKVDTILDGAAWTTLRSHNVDTFSIELYAGPLYLDTKLGTTQLGGRVEVRALRDYWQSTQEFNGYVGYSLDTKDWLHVASGLARRFGAASSGANIGYEGLDVLLPIPGSRRIGARLRQGDANLMRVDASGVARYAPAEFTQGSLVIELEPGKADGYRLELRVTGVGQFVLEHRAPGGRLLSSQPLTQEDLRTATSQ